MEQKSLIFTQSNEVVDKKRDSLAWLKSKAAEAERIQKKRQEESPLQLFLPGMEEFMRAMPNHVARSSLFAPIARGKKQIHKGLILKSRGDAVIKFWGEELDESQADIWMQCMKEAQKLPLGVPIVINRAKFLREIGRHTGNYEYKWLHRSMQSLAFAMLIIEVIKKNGEPKLSIGQTRALHLIDGYDYDDLTQEYTLRIDPRWHEMYANNEFALINWDKRLKFKRNQDMAKSLQRLLATSSNKIQRYTLDWLKEKMRYTSPMRKFEVSLVSASEELKRLKIASAYKIVLNNKKEKQITYWLS